MKKLITLILACVLCASFVLAAQGEVTQADIEQGIIGKWMMVERDGKPLLTNIKAVHTFESPAKAYISASVAAQANVTPAWDKLLEMDVAITDNKITLTGHPDDKTTVEHAFTITSITDSEFIAEKGSRTVDGNIVNPGKEAPVRFVKITEDYSDDIIGTWEGRCTSEGSVFDDGQVHRWEYRADGTYVYYVKDGDNWVPGTNTLNEYFVDGVLLCTRWIDNGQENREWWEIRIEDGKMTWTALRANEDGTTYTVTFEMSKVD